MSNIYDLPEIRFVDTDAGNIEESIITTYEALSGKSLFPGDPVRLFLEAIAAIIIQQRIVINESAKQNLLRFAMDEKLDHLGAFQKTPRLDEDKAKTILEFIISAAQQNVIVVPKGTRATPGDKIYFETTEPAEIPIGETKIQVPAACTVAGEIGNDFIPGQINKIVDLFPYFQAVGNITKSSGGADIEDNEPYRERIHLAPERTSTAGPDGAYIYHAKRASQLIIDVATLSPEPGKVDIIVLADGETTEEILKLVRDTCNDREVRPLTDFLTVKAPEKVPYKIEGTYYISKDMMAKVTSIQDEVNKAKDSFIKWQKSKLGRNINPSELISQLMKAGASRVQLTSPAFIVLEKHQIAAIDSANLTYGGIEDE